MPPANSRRDRAPATAGRDCAARRCAAAGRPAVRRAAWPSRRASRGSGVRRYGSGAAVRRGRRGSTGGPGRWAGAGRCARPARGRQCRPSARNSSKLWISCASRRMAPTMTSIMAKAPVRPGRGWGGGLALVRQQALDDAPGLHAAGVDVQFQQVAPWMAQQVALLAFEHFRSSPKIFPWPSRMLSVSARSWAWKLRAMPQSTRWRWRSPG